MKSSITQIFRMSLPLIVAPLGGGPTTPELVIASCEAGALGSVAGAYLSPEELKKSIEKVKAATTRAFAVNLFVPTANPSLTPEQIDRAIRATTGFRQELDLPTPQVKPPYHQNFDWQFEVVMQAKPAAFSFVFGLLDREYLQECRKRGILTMGAVTTLEEAHLLAESGVDFIVAQGIEAGGHRALFEATSEDEEAPTADLVSMIVNEIPLPVIASGGIMTSGQIQEMLSIGAQAVQMGTAFLLCKEAGTSRAYREALKMGSNDRIKSTRAFSGRLARGIENRFMREIDQRPESILPFPVQNAFTKDIRTKSSQLDLPEFLSLWAGSGVQYVQSDISAIDIITQLKRELRG
jgi:nitronate monooxygenase